MLTNIFVREKKDMATTSSYVLKTKIRLCDEIGKGDWVLAVGNNDYRNMIGLVIAVERYGSPEHYSDNEVDDIHVDFTAFNYSDSQISEVETKFSEVHGERVYFDDLSLDDVIMSPDMLICISDFCYDDLEYIEEVA